MPPRWVVVAVLAWLVVSAALQVTINLAMH